MTCDPFDTPERRDLRAMVRRFVDNEVLPSLNEWEAEGMLPGHYTRRPATPG